MEQAPQGNEHTEHQQPEPERPLLSLDLAGEQGNVYAVIVHARHALPLEAQELFRQEIQAATAPDARKTYEDILGIVNTHVDLVDTSNTYPQYAWQGKVTDAVAWLNEQIAVLPESVPCGINGLYPDFDNSDTSPQAYLDVLWHEMAQTEQLLSQHDGDQREHLEHYRNLLMTTIARFFRYGLL